MGEREIDQALVERAQAGDKHAFELLVVKYQRSWRGCCRASFVTRRRWRRVGSFH